MKIRCPKCGGAADVDEGWERIHCGACGLDTDYQGYLSILLERETRYQDILSDYPP